ncbi:RNI-like superfamily protein [Rhynchospora pubera]|uniref:RNI-like superfamily protein n=1 Tax=Rhynchospora pubera TaxID=906938 RepID=A0AAV8HEY3_9POAL|nr:RNI-like superfamily protein [Rhynchospora pubera]
MGKSKKGKQREQFETTVLSRFVLRWEKSVFLKKRKWTELPSDILLIIFQKLGPINVLTKAIRVCRDWLELARSELVLWRKVDMTCHGKKFGPNYLEDIACIAVNWSAGRLEEFSAEEFGTYDLLQYITDSASNLKCIRLIRSHVEESELEKLIKRWLLLEEIELTRHWCSPELCEAIGLLCPRLKHFRLNELYFGCGSNKKNLIANYIGKTMPNLRSLQLIGSSMTEEGLHAILEGCPQLESLDIRNCDNLTINQRIQSELERIKILRLPNDSTIDYKFHRHVTESSPCWGPCSLCYGSDSNSDSDIDSDTETYFDIKYGHIVFQNCE